MLDDRWSCQTKQNGEGQRRFLDLVEEDMHLVAVSKKEAEDRILQMEIGDLRWQSLK